MSKSFQLKYQETSYTVQILLDPDFHPLQENDCIGHKIGVKATNNGREKGYALFFQESEDSPTWPIIHIFTKDDWNSIFQGSDTNKIIEMLQPTYTQEGKSNSELFLKLTEKLEWYERANFSSPVRNKFYNTLAERETPKNPDTAVPNSTTAGVYLKQKWPASSLHLCRMAAIRMTQGY